MDLTGSRKIAATRADVWNAILSPDCLKACVPGCTEMSGSSESGFEATVVQKVGPVKATFTGRVTLSDMIPLTSLTLVGEGRGGAAGFAKGGAKVHLVEYGPDTVLHYYVDAKVGGKLAQLGSRIIEGFAKKMADQFFSNLQDQIEGTGDGGAPEQKKKGWLGKLVS